MTFNYIIKGVRVTPLHIFAILALLTLGGAAAILNQHVATSPVSSHSNNPILDSASYGQPSEFRDQRLSEAQGVGNIVNNVLSGAVKPGDGSHRLLEIELYAKSDIDLSPEDTATNVKYVDFVMSSEDVINSYMYKTGNVVEMQVLTKEKRDKI